MAELRVQDLGRLTGDVLLFGGCLSNLPATRALIARAKGLRVPATNMICSGDVVGYCADGPATVAAIRNSGCAVIAGNVERQLATGAGDCGCGFEAGSTCDLLSAGWYTHADQTTDATTRSWMADLPDIGVFTHGSNHYAVIHGGVTDISRFLWPVSDAADFADEIAALRAACGKIDGVICGHSGIAFQRRIDGVDWINAGVIGLPPHDGRRETRFAVLGERGVTIERLEYDFDQAVDAMQAAGLTHGYDMALATGIWPSEEVLPTELRRQGAFANG